MAGSKFSRRRNFRRADGESRNALSHQQPLITEDVEIRGELSFAGRLEFNGRLDGNMCAGGDLVVGKEALIRGTVESEAADVAGKIQGDLIVTGRLHLRPDAMVYGNIMGGGIVVDQGAVVDGMIITERPDRPSPDFSHIFRHLSKDDAGDKSGNA